MATLAMSQPPLNPIFRESGVDSMRSQDQGIALPSIRQAIPELHLTTPSSEMRSRYSVGASPTDYIHTKDQKRRRISDEEERDSLKSNIVPRLYRSPEQPSSRQMSPHHQTSPHFPHDAYNPRNAQPTKVQVLNQSSRQSLPSLYDFSASVGVEAKPSPPMKRPAPEMDDYRRHDEMARRSYDYGYAHAPSHHYHSASPSSSQMYERPMTSSSNYATHYHEAGRYGELGIMAMGNDTKLRKRRGNLPKETTDKLRSWFVAHLQHPYPTEDEKQELMRQTGLQMNQISNWFINARRRQLPAMINNARAETDAMNGGIGSSSNSHLGRNTLSDGEGDSYDDVRDMRHHRGDGKRESV